MKCLFLLLIISLCSCSATMPAWDRKTPMNCRRIYIIDDARKLRPIGYINQSTGEITCIDYTHQLSK